VDFKIFVSNNIIINGKLLTTIMTLKEYVCQPYPNGNVNYIITDVRKMMCNKIYE
jgi:hypothetical protein